MKRILAVVLLLAMLTGCESSQMQMDRVMELRQKITATGCEFDVGISADYGQEVYSFSMHCTLDSQGTMTFCVTEPQTISGITGTISQGKGNLTFDGMALAFQTMSDGLVTPVTGPWLLTKALRGGYIHSCGMDESYLRVSMEDSYEQDSLRLDVWLTEETVPAHADIYWKENRILSLQVANFCFV